MNFGTRWVLMEEANDTNSGGGSESSGIDVDATVESWGQDLGLTSSSTADKGGAPDDEPAGTPSGETSPGGKEPSPTTPVKDVPKLGADGKPIQAATPTAPSAPKSWKKEMHDHFGKLPKEVQDYVTQRETEIEQGFKQYGEATKFAEAMRTVLQPYRPLLDSQNAKDDVQTVRYLLNAHYQLSSADEAARTRYMAQLAKAYRIPVEKIIEAAGGEDPYKDPAYKELKERLDKAENERAAAHRAEFERVKAKTQSEVETFAKDPAHPYFDQVADHIALLLQDPRISLKDAYEQAVWANPNTRTKEQARLQKEQEEKLRQEAAEQAEKARRAKGTDIRGREARRSPQGNGLDSIGDTMAETLKDIKSRGQNRTH